MKPLLFDTYYKNVLCFTQNKKRRWTHATPIEETVVKHCCCLLLWNRAAQEQLIFFVFVSVARELLRALCNRFKTSSEISIRSDLFYFEVRTTYFARSRFYRIESAKTSCGNNLITFRLWDKKKTDKIGSLMWCVRFAITFTCVWIHLQMRFPFYFINDKCSVMMLIRVFWFELF